MTYSEGLVGAATRGLCNLLSDGSQFAAEAASLVVGSDGPNPFTVLNNVVRNVCNREPPPIPPLRPTPGQCPGIPYRWSSSWTIYNKADKSTLSGLLSALCGSSGQIYGPVSGPYKVVAGNNFYYQISGFDSGGGPVTRDVTSSYSQTLYLMQGLNFTINRCSGSVDNCGGESYPPPANPEYRSQPQTITYINNEGNTVNLDVIVQFSPPVINADLSVVIPINVVSANVNVGAQVDVNIPLTVNGPNFSFGGSSSSPPGSTPTPSPSPAPTPTPGECPCVEELTDIAELIGSVSATVNEVKTELNELSETVGTPGLLYRAAQGEPCPPIEYEPLSLSDALTVGLNSVLFLERRDCPKPSVPETLIQEGTATQSQQVVYVAVSDEVKSVRVRLLTPLPPKVAYTMSNEIGGYFGAVSTTYGTASGEVQQLFTTNTYHKLEDVPDLRQVRLYLKPGIQWQLFDTGER